MPLMPPRNWFARPDYGQTTKRLRLPSPATSKNTMTKLCLNCTNFFFMLSTESEYGYTIADIECERGHWRLPEYAGDADLREVMLTARTCDDYDEIREGE